MCRDISSRALTPKHLVPFDAKLEDLIELVRGNRERDWVWALNARCKYLFVYNINGIVHVTDRFDVPVNLNQIKHQF
jgi:hypothetical protein